MDMYYRDPDLQDWSALVAVTAEGETERSMDDIATTREMNLEQRGDAIYREVGIDKPKTAADGSRSAVVSYCFDPTRLDLVDTGTGDPVPRTLEDTLVSEVTMKLFPDGTWRAVGYTSEFQRC